MGQDTPDLQNLSSQNLSPQDPARFSKAKSEPPILDLEAEKPMADTKSERETDRPDQAPRQHDTLRVEKQAKRQWPIGGVFGGLISGGLVALAALFYANWQQHAAVQITDLETALATKSDQSQIEPILKRVTDLEAELADLKKAMASITERNVGLDTELLKRVDAIEAEIATLSGREPTIATASPQIAKLSLSLSVRDRLAKDKSIAKELAALEALGETGTAFTSLQRLTATPLLSYAELITRVESKPLKAPSTATPPKSETSPDQSSWGALISRFVTVRPVEQIEPVKKQDLSLESVLDALESEDAVKAIALIEVLPDVIRTDLKDAESEIARRAAAESASEALADAALDLIMTESKP